MIKIVCLFLILLTANARAIAETMDGYVTDVMSSIQFDIGQIQVTLGNHTECNKGLIYGIAVRSGNFSFHPSAWYLPGPKHFFGYDSIKTSPIPCSTMHLTVGSDVHLSGSRVSAGTFVARSVLVYVIQQPDSLRGSATLEEDPVRDVSHNSTESDWIDGYNLQLRPTTKFLSATRDQSAKPSFLRAGMRVNWEASRIGDQSLVADSLEMTQIPLTTSESNFRKLFAATVTPPNYGNHVPGTIHFANGVLVSIVPNRHLQDFVSRLGMDLVPEYQKLLPNSNVSKIPFRFWIVQSSEAAGKKDERAMIDGSLPRADALGGYDYADLSSAERLKQIIALPTGLVVIPDAALANLDNEAQVGALLSYAITAILQKDVDDAWRVAWSRNWKDQMDLFQTFLSLNEQVVRIGIRQMYLANYDIREAPWAWDVALGHSVNNPMIGKQSKQIKPWYAGYAFNYISQYYSGVDYSKLKKGEAEYAQFLGELREADPTAFEKK